MPGVRYDLTRNNNLGQDHPFEHGAKFSLSVTIKDDGSARDLTGHVARFGFKTDWDDSTTILSYDSSVDSEFTITALSGLIVLDVPVATVNGLTTRNAELEKEHGSDRGPGVYTLELENASGEPEVLLYGLVSVEPRGTV